ncbi:MAG: hypothetical protein E6767_10400 [Dysgonomonas sp.]|nr:hypothetical protein [Dysgonomonas sp.]
MKSLFRNRLFYIIIGTCLIAILFSGIAFFNKIAGKRIIFLPPDFNEYPLIDNYEHIYKPIYGVVKEVKLHSDIGYITLTNGSKFSIDKRTENLECKPPQLSYFIQIGDSIAKPKEDFVFFIHRKMICYPFKIRERLRALPIDMSKKENH